MHQPIHWQEWGEDAFATAQRENKPVLLDIGAVWCHWCHVMDRESYDSPEIAQIINERFVAVKVDRDERPDIDSRYQVAISAITGQGGWPLTAFLTPDGKPFYGGTYFPPQDHYGRPSFKRVLLSIADAYREKHGDVMEQAQMVESAISQAESLTGKQGEFSPRIVDAIIESAVGMFDADNGGFGSAPKFPHPAAMDLIIDQYAQTGDENLRMVFVTSLTRMAQGGVYDQLAGGFHRYSVDERWIVPHFEKMSYDNSELLKNYVHAYQATGSEFFANVARDIIRWVDEWLSDREHGGFYASQDADLSMDDDGDYFTWSAEEARAVLTPDEFTAASLRYDIGDVGEMHHNPAKNVLFVRASLKDIANQLRRSEEEAQSLLDSAKKKMYTARLARPTPYVDKTIYVSWNALFVSAYLEAARVLDLVESKHFALRSLDRIFAEAWDSERGLLHVIAYSDPKTERREVAAGLEDYAFTTVAYLDAYEATSDRTYYNFAQQLGDQMVRRFFDPTGGGFFDTAQTDGEKSLGVLGSRRKPFQDSPTPAGNSMAAIALLRLYRYTNNAAYYDQAEQTLELLAGAAGRHGIFAGTYGIAAVHFSRRYTQVIVAGDDELADQLCRTAVAPMSLTKAVIKISLGDTVPQKFPPALAETIPNLPAMKEQKSFAVVCANFTCQPAIYDSEELNGALIRAGKQKRPM
jgi:uncharacterized protein YyaL (SSP411 family)